MKRRQRQQKQTTTDTSDASEYEFPNSKRIRLINQRTSSSSSSSSSSSMFPALPPTLGKIGSLLFFGALFAGAHPDRDGYEEFRKCHRHCGNGILHAIGMPIAVSGVFLVVRAAAASAPFARVLHTIVTTLYLILYLVNSNNSNDDSMWSLPPWLFYVTYLGIFELFLQGRFYHAWSRATTAWVGIAAIAIPVATLEVVGHGMWEGHHSYVSEFFNSVFHTPLYGIQSVLLSSGLAVPRDDHTCFW